MLNIFRVAARSGAALALAFGTIAAQPAHAADGAANGTAASATIASEAAMTPGVGSLSDIVERAVAAPAAAEAAAEAAADSANAAAIPARPDFSADRARPLAALVAESTTLDARDEQAQCLASAIYWESKGEPLVGQLAVAEVIINRAASGRFAPTLCGVITQRSQFSFVRGGRIPTPPRTAAAWRTAVAIAHIALDDRADSPVSTALFFHANYVSPGWRLRRLASVGNHIFYR